MTTTTHNTDALSLYIDLKNKAEKNHRQYPQYRGHWDGWLVGRMKKDIRRHGGGFLMVAKDETVLLDPASIEGKHITVHSQSYAASDHGMDVLVPCSSVEILG